MRRLWIMLRFEFKNLLHSRGAAAGLALTLAAGGYSIYYGRAELAEQQRVIALLDEFERDDTTYVGKEFPEGSEAGAVAYYHYHPAAHPPSPWAALAIGQRDVHPYFLKINLLGLYGQLFGSDLDNPLKALSGNFDLSFVLVTLFPLLIIGLGYNLLSAEEDQGTLPLLRSLATPLAQVAAVKLAARFILVSGLACALLVASFWLNGLPLAGRAAAWLALTMAYLAFWFAAVAFVASWRGSTSANATALLGAWLGLAVVAPAGMNLATSAYYPVPHGYEIAVGQRQAAHGGWDRPKEEIFARFGQLRPEHADAPIPKGFAWSTYFAMQELGDAAVAEPAGRYLGALRARQTWSERLGGFSPPVAAQLLFNRLAGTDLSAQLDYLDSVGRYHESLKAHFYPLIFDEKTLKAVEYEAFPAHRFSPREGSLGRGLIPLLAASTLLLAASPFILGWRSREGR